jgi:hypothetical protein
MTTRRWLGFHLIKNFLVDEIVDEVRPERRTG